jgi:type IV fimbrial biogenesis protein FimT
MQMKWNAVCPPRRRGFTLVETLAVVALLAVIAVLGTPSFVAWYVRDQVDARAKALASTLAYARSEALRQGARVTVCRTDAARPGPAAGRSSLNEADRHRYCARSLSLQP